MARDKTKDKDKINCEVCGRYMRADNLKEHIKRKHQKVTETCPMCSKQFYNSGSLKRHLLLCTNNTSTADDKAENIAVNDDGMEYKT